MHDDLAQNSFSGSREAGGRNWATNFGCRGFEMSTTSTPSAYQEKYARLPMIFGSWTPSVKPDAPRFLAAVTRRAGGLKTLSSRGLRGFEMFQKEGRPPVVSWVSISRRPFGAIAVECANPCGSAVRPR